MSLERRTPLRRDTPKTRAWLAKPRARIRQRSKKQTADDRVFAMMRVIVLERDGHRCQLAYRMDGHICSGGLHVHHLRLRSQGGTHHPDNLLTLCEGAHTYAHTRQAEAALFGIIELRPDAEEVPDA